MSIKEFIEKSKRFPYENRDAFIVVIIVLVAFGSFGLGRLSKIEELKPPVMIENMNASVLNTVLNKSGESALLSDKKTSSPSVSTAKQAVGFYIGSKNGSKYHFPWCSGAKRIKEGNKIIFNTKEEAREAGYTPAGNCKGLR